MKNGSVVFFRFTHQSYVNAYSDESGLYPMFEIKKGDSCEKNSFFCMRT